MLDALRRHSTGWVVKILLGFLVISFAVWGVGDIFSGFGRARLAEVGGREISPVQFQREYQNQLFVLGQQIGRQVTSAEARALKVAQRVLDNLVASTAVSMHAEKLGLNIADQTITDAILKDPSFMGEGGKFDRAAFDNVLNNMGLSEAGFVSLQRQDYVRNQIVHTLTGSAYAPDTLAKALYRYRNDQRMLKYFVVPVDVAGKVDAPDEAAIAAYYEAHKSEFKAPEYRKVGMILLSVSANMRTAPVTDADVKNAYETSKKKFGTPELRTIEQLSFKDKAAAEEARRKLAAGADFLKLGEELGLKEADIKLGAVAEDKFADPKVAEVAFRLEKNKVSNVIEGFFPVLVRVTAIEPGTQKSFDEVKDEIRDSLVKANENQAKAHAAEELSKLYDDIESARKKGATLAEIAEKLNVRLEEPVFDRQGMGQDGKPAASVARRPEIAKLAFDSDVGVENNPVSFADGNAFVDVREVIPERQRPVDEMRDEIKKAWIEAETRKRVNAKTDELLAKVRGGEKLDAVAASVHAKVVETPLLKRNSQQTGLQPSTVVMAFTLPENGAAWAQTPDLKTRLVFQVAQLKPADDPDAKQLEQLRGELRRSMGMDLITQYVGGLQAAYGVQTNTKIISDLMDTSE